MGQIAFKVEKETDHFCRNFNVTPEVWLIMFRKGIELMQRTETFDETLAQMRMVYPDHNDACIAVTTEIKILYGLMISFSNTVGENPKALLSEGCTRIADLLGMQIIYKGKKV